MRITSPSKSLSRNSSFSKKMTMPIEFMDEYSKDATIHGVKYFSERKRHWLEKTFWISIFVVSIAFCVKNVVEIYEKRQERPVMVSFAKSLTPMFEIPFPAVTICPEFKTNKEKFNLPQMLKESDQEFSEDELLGLKALYQVCDENDFVNVSQALNQTERDFDIISTLKELGYPITEIFDRCRFGSRKLTDCKKLFSEVVTDEGICYTFNMLDKRDLFTEALDESSKFPDHKTKSDWFLEKEYESLKMNVYPHRVIGSGIYSGLSVDLKIRKSELNPTHRCKHGVQGFRLSLHIPVDIPKLSKAFYSIPINRQTTITVHPHMIYSSKDVRQYDPVSRQCYFNDERKLKFFKTYTKSSCELECLAEQAFLSCGCVKFSMPHDNATKVCDVSKLNCIHEAEYNYTIRDLERKLLMKQMKRDLKHGKASKDDPRFEQLRKMESCNCLSSCSSLKYDAEISQTDFLVNENDDFVSASVNIYFKSADFTRLKRYEIYGFSDFLSSTGGIFGLFLGCSVISFIEIVYHLISYCVRKIKRQTSEMKSDVPT